MTQRASHSGQIPAESHVSSGPRQGWTGKRILLGAIALFGAAFGFSWVGYWLNWRWLQWLAFGAGAVSTVLIAVGGILVNRQWQDAWREWGERRMTGAAQSAPAEVGSPSGRPNER
jgi:uncharacterized membrane protein YcjF (UPF0283 family)